MRWTPGGRSVNIEDRRSEGADEAGFGPPFRGMRIGLGGAVILLALSVLTGQNFFVLLGPALSPQEPVAESRGPYRPASGEVEMVQFVSFVLDDTQGVWSKTLPRYGRRYQDAKLVLFNSVVRSGCGVAETAMGPFYCPADGKVYIDLGFYQELRNRFGAPGDFAQAYVIAHELGHHVQHLLGIAGKVEALQQRYPDRANELSVRLELQADCLAGVWGHSTDQRQILERGDAEEGIAAAAAVGDDRIQKQAGMGVNPETWTHGSARQRVAWFTRGLQTGDVEACDTFSGGADAAS